MSYGLTIFVTICTLLLFGLALPVVRVARRSLAPWTRTLAAVLVLLSVTLLLFLFAEDGYRQDGTRNYEAYDVEYPVLPTVVLAGVAAWWLVRREGSRAVALAAPLIAIGSAAAAGLCFLFTTN